MASARIYINKKDILYTAATCCEVLETTKRAGSQSHFNSALHYYQPFSIKGQD